MKKFFIAACVVIVLAAVAVSIQKANARPDAGVDGSRTCIHLPNGRLYCR